MAQQVVCICQCVSGYESLTTQNSFRTDHTKHHRERESLPEPIGSAASATDVWLKSAKRYRFHPATLTSAPTGSATTPPSSLCRGDVWVCTCTLLESLGESRFGDGRHGGAARPTSLTLVYQHWSSILDPLVINTGSPHWLQSSSSSSSPSSMASKKLHVRPMLDVRDRDRDWPNATEEINWSA